MRGVVGWNGRAILIPGRSFAGKTTLVAELLRAGAVYYSDEYAVLDSRGRVHPYERPLGMRSDPSFRSSRIRVEDFGAESATKPLPVGLVVSARYQVGARWRPRQLTAGRGVLELLENTVTARTRPEFALQVLSTALPNAQILKGVRGEASEIVDPF
jgi:hypothetical protein